MTDNQSLTTTGMNRVKYVCASREVTTATIYSLYSGSAEAMHQPVRPPQKKKVTTDSLLSEFREYVRTGPSDAIVDSGVVGVDFRKRSRMSKNAAAIALIEKWLAEDSNYDEEAWPSLKAGIEESRLSARKRFSE